MKKVFPLFLIFILMGSACSRKERKEKNEIPIPTTVTTPSGALAPVLPQTTPSPGKVLGPLDSIKELDNKVSSYKSGSNLTPAEIEANRKLKEDVIRGTFDMYELSRLALDMHWNEITEKDRTYFSNLMINLLEKKALLSKEQVKSDTKPYHITYKKEEYIGLDRKLAMVFTILSVPSEKVNLTINYRLILTPTGWHIFDVIVDDASLVENYKFQFDTIIRKYGYPELVARMEQKLKEMD